jgi:hypothetical protein
LNIERARRLALAGLVLLATPAFAADPTGHYLIEGANPGGKGSYAGTVDVTRTGDTLRIVWTIGNQRYVGTGIGTSSGIAVSYRSGNDTGLAIYSEEGKDWSGVWTYAGATQLGTERWVRK